MRVEVIPVTGLPVDARRRWEDVQGAIPGFAGPCHENAAIDKRG